MRVFGSTIAPLYLPLVSAFLNRVVANLPWVDELGLNYIVVARPMAPQSIAAARPRSVSIIVPACNEAGNIRPLLSRIPKFAEKQEIIFVEGGSTDHTWEAIQDAARDYDGLQDIRCLKQNGKGKADAVRLGNKSEQIRVAVEAPGFAGFEDFEIALPIPVDQFVRQFPFAVFVGKFDGDGADPGNIDDGDEPVGQDAFDGYSAFQIFESGHGDLTFLC